MQTIGNLWQQWVLHAQTLANTYRHTYKHRLCCDFYFYAEVLKHQ